MSPETYPLELQEFGEAKSGSVPAIRVYAATIVTTRPPGDFTPRIVPQHPDALVPLEAGEILWYR
jgi:starch phosphorylase